MNIEVTLSNYVCENTFILSHKLSIGMFWKCYSPFCIPISNVSFNNTLSVAYTETQDYPIALCSCMATTLHFFSDILSVSFPLLTALHTTIPMSLGHRLVWRGSQSERRMRAVNSKRFVIAVMNKTQRHS